MLRVRYGAGAYHRPSCRTSLLAIAGLLLAAGAFAQAPPPPTIIAPFPVAAPPVGSPLPGIEPLDIPRLAPGLPRPAAPEPGPAITGGPGYPIGSVLVDGVTAFPPAEIARFTEGLTGPSIPEARIEAARRAIVDLYRSKGYVYTTANAIIENGTLRFAVIEGYISEVKLDGDIGPAGTQVLRFLNNLIGQKPLSSSQLERWLLLAQDIPGLTIRSTLNPSLGDPGVLTLVAQVSRKAVSGLITADNRAFNLSGPAQGLIAVNLDSFTEYGERTQLSFFSSFNFTNRFGQITEEFFVGGSGLKARLYAGGGIATPSGSLAAIGYNGTTRVFGGQLMYPLLRARDQSLNIGLTFDAIESDIGNDLGPFGFAQRASFDSLRVVRAGFDYALLDTLLGDQRSGVNGITLRASKGLPWLGASANGDVSTPPPRIGEQINFGKVAGELSRTQMLFQPFQDSAVTFRTAVAWQYSADLLPPAEKFYLGGPRFNRGYYFGQVTGDSGVTASAELQWTVPVPLPQGFPYDPRAQLYSFWDWGKAYQNTPLEANVTLQSLGGGVRLFLTEWAEIDLEGVYRFNRYPNGQGPNVAPLNTAAFYWQLLLRF